MKYSSGTVGFFKRWPANVGFVERMLHAGVLKYSMVLLVEMYCILHIAYGTK